jgi:hypothetical protein
MSEGVIVGRSYEQRQVNSSLVLAACGHAVVGMRRSVSARAADGADGPHGRRQRLTAGRSVADARPRQRKGPIGRRFVHPAAAACLVGAGAPRYDSAAHYAGYLRTGSPGARTPALALSAPDDVVVHAWLWVLYTWLTKNT